MEDFAELKNNIKNCRFCESKFGFCPHPIVFGSENSKIFQISQAPSKNVHITGKPFDDLSGKKLKYCWYQVTDDIFYNSHNFYIAALSHCYPGRTASGNDKQPPKNCKKRWLEKEMKIVKNELYIIIGRSAAKSFFPEEKYDKLIFSDNILNEKKCLVLPHPSLLNIRWFKEHPEFEEYRINEIRKSIKKVLEI